MNIYQYAHDYRSYLKDRLSEMGGRGQRSRLAQHLNCDAAYISRVFSSTAQLSPEQAHKTNAFLDHDEEASHFFLLIVQKERAGSYELAQYYQRQIDEVLNSRKDLQKRVQGSRSLELHQQAKYYSRWYYSAIHVATAATELQTRDALIRKFKLPSPVVDETLSFLIEIGLIIKQKGKYLFSSKNLHLLDHSNFIQTHHSNWLNRSLSALDNYSRDKNLHYSGTFAIGQKDIIKLREKLAQSLEEFLKEVSESEAEEVYALNINFFEA